MITKFKLYETIDIGVPKIGDYVICYNHYGQTDLSEWLNYNIGKIINFYAPPGYFNVYYENIPSDLNVYFLSRFNKGGYKQMMNSEILHWSKDKEDLKVFFDANKYNL